jgi:N-acyl-phosphatidylethanolamine-hydrolysing phospholipase D
VRVPEVHTHDCYNTDHHVPGPKPRFTNPWPQKQRKITVKGLTWAVFHTLTTNKSRQLFTGQPPPAAKSERVPYRPIDHKELAAPLPAPRLFWLGHATTLIQLKGQTILTDPVLGRQIGPLPAVKPLTDTAVKQLNRNFVMRAPRQPEIPLPVAHFPHVDVVLISHNHYDHLDKASVWQLAQTFAPLFIVPLGVGDYLRKWGIERVVELDWWQFVTYKGVRYHCTPACHGSQRYLYDRHRSLWSGWFMEKRCELGNGRFSLFFAGDTAYADHFRAIRRCLGRPDMALLPIGAYAPRWYLQELHLSPDEALQAFCDLQAEKLVPIHWGTFDLGQEPIHLPGQLLTKLARRRGIAAEKVCVLPVGGAAIAA